MKRILAVIVVLGALLGLALLATPAQATDPDYECEVGINYKTGQPCGGSTVPPPPPEPCNITPDGCVDVAPFDPVTCGSCNTPVLCATSVWWGGAFGSWLLVVGVMGGIGLPLWRHRKKGRLPVDLLRQRMEIEAKERARRFREAEKPQP